MACSENVGLSLSDELITTNLVQRVNEARLIFKRLKAFELKTGYSDPLSFLSDLESIPILLDDLPINNGVAFVKTDSTSLNDISIMGYILTEKYVKFFRRLRSKFQSMNASDPFYGDSWKAPHVRESIVVALHSAAEVLSHKIPKDDGAVPYDPHDPMDTFRLHITTAKKELLSYEESRANTKKPGASLNTHFLLPRAATNIYTGNTPQQAKLRAAFRDTASPGQRIFVVLGPGGSGKTEIALKYAEDARNQFWGVFFVDGSSQKAALRSYIEIARIVDVEPTQKAVALWLSTQALPWLLILDDARGDAHEISSLLPTGQNGCILITSRIPSHKVYGTAGERFLELPPLREQEAVDLVLKAAQKPTPWPERVRQEARRTAQATGYLPLALVVAGKMIRHDHCPWVDYIFSHQYHKYIMARHHYGGDDMWKALIYGHDIDQFNLFAAFETSYRRLEIESRQSYKDACELLLKLFAYFDSQKVSLDYLVNTAIDFEERVGRNEGTEASGLTWFDPVNNSDVLAIPSTPKWLPEFMKNSKRLSRDAFEKDVRTRLCKATETLVSYSLIVKDDWPERRYSTNPIVYQWLRERSTMLVTEQHASPLRRSEADRLDYATDHVYNNDTWQRDTENNLRRTRSSKSSIFSSSGNKEPDIGLYIVSALSLAFAESDSSYLSTRHGDSSHSRPEIDTNARSMTNGQDIKSTPIEMEEQTDPGSQNIMAEALECISTHKMLEEDIKHDEAAPGLKDTSLSQGQNGDHVDSSVGDEMLPRPRSRLIDASAYSTTLPQFLDSILEMIPIPFHYIEPPVPPGQTRIKWKCRCGTNLFDDFIEVEPGSLQKLQDSLHHSGYDEEPSTAMQKSYGFQTFSETARYIRTWLIQGFTTVVGRDTTTLPLHQSTSTDTPSIPLPPRSLLYLLFCTHAGETGSKLHQERLTNITSDRELLLFLRDAYKTHRKVFSWLTLRGVTNVSLARFMVDSSEFTEVHRHAHVCASDCICLPPVDRVGTEYNCRPAPEVKPKYFPAIGSRYLTHHFTHPDCVRPTQRFIYNQLPKRTCGQLLASEDQVEFGWGIYFEEGWHWRSIYFVVVVLIASASGVFGVTWSITKGDVQGGFAVSSAWITLGSLLLGYIAVRSF